MRYFLIIIIFAVFFLSATAQDAQPCLCDEEINDVFEPKLSGEIYQPLTSFVGEEFFNIHYVKGDIVLNNGEIITNKLIRYNGRIDGLLFWAPNGQEILLDNYFIKEFCLKNYNSNPKIFFKKIKVIKEFGSDTMEVFGQVLYQNKLSLYVFRHYVHDMDVIKYVGNTRGSVSSYSPSPIYYFQIPNHKTIGFKRFKKRDLYMLFPGKKDTIKKIFKEKHQHRFRKEEDLIRIAEILNPIIN